MPFVRTLFAGSWKFAFGGWNVKLGAERLDDGISNLTGYWTACLSQFTKAAVVAYPCRLGGSLYPPSPRRPAVLRVQATSTAVFNIPEGPDYRELARFQICYYCSS